MRAPMCAITYRLAPSFAACSLVGCSGCNHLGLRYRSARGGVSSEAEAEAEADGGKSVNPFPLRLRLRLRPFPGLPRDMVNNQFSSEMNALTIEQILALAPDSTSAKAGQGLATPRK